MIGRLRCWIAGGHDLRWDGSEKFARCARCGQWIARSPQDKDHEKGI